MPLLGECTLGNFVLGELACGIIPDYTAHVDLDGDDFAETALGRFVEAVSLNRGVDPEFGGIMSASAVLTFRNQDRRFALRNSPYMAIRVWQRVTLRQRDSNGIAVEQFNGYIREPGLAADPNVLQATWDTTDLIERLRRIKISTPLYTGYRSDQLIAAILLLAGYTGATNLEVGAKTFAYASWRKVAALEAIQDVVNSEIGSFTIDAQGRPAFFARTHRATTTSPVLSLVKQADLYHRVSADDIFNDAQVTCYPRLVGSAGTELWRWQEVPVTLTAGQTVTVEAEFTDGANGADCEASVVMTPVATTDYTAFTTPVSGGVSKTAQLSVVFTAYGRYAVIQMTNTDPGTIYVRLFKIRGTPVTVPNSVTVSASNSDSIAAYKITKTISIDQPLETDTAAAQDAANYLADLYGNPPDRITVVLKPGDADKIDALATLDLNDLVAITEPVTGFDATGFFIDSISMNMDNQALTREITYQMSRANNAALIVLDSPSQTFDDVLGF